MDTTLENKSKVQATIFSVGIFALLFLFIFFWKIITPNPPFEIKPVPEIEIGLGMEGLGNTDAGGSGQNDDDIATSEEAAVTPAVSDNTPNIMTDNTEESAVVKTNPNNKNDAKTVENPVVEQKTDANLLTALAVLKNKNKHDGKGEGDGNTGGSGTGTQQGVGDGSGTGHGNNTPGYNGGGGYELKGRRLVKRPDKMTDSEEEGVVVVEIIVNETGKVIRATPGMRGSTTTSANLYAKARQAAMGVKFNESPEGVKEQRGTYTFKFTLE